jgi:signal transduction histidine kinase
VREGLRSAAARARSLRAVVADVGAVAIRDDVDELSGELDEVEQVAERAVADRSLLRILASVGTQMAAFVHETHGLAGAAASVSRALGSLANANPSMRRELLDLQSEVATVGARIDSQARYLAGATAVGTRRRRQRLKVAERLSAATGLLEPAAERLGVTIETNVNLDLRTVPMYPAELTVVLTNLLTNAIKAAGKGGRVRFDAERDDGGLSIRVANTGAAVDPAEGEQWFAPFASTTIEQIDPLLGQGMGLGLPITRSIVEDYRGSVRFVTPPAGFRTGLEVRLP